MDYRATVMRCVVCREHGSVDYLVIEDRPEPMCEPHQVVVDIAYAAVNFPDVLIIENKYQVSVPAPFVPGSEFSGVVSRLGDSVENIRLGDHVSGATMNGAFAEKIVVDASTLRVLDPSIALDKAAAFWVAHATAYHALRSVAEVLPGEKVLILGAAGGVGLAAVEIAALRGAEVIAAASSDDKLAVCIQRGARHTVNYLTSDLRDSLRLISAHGVDVVIDPVGGPLAEKALRTLRWKGRFVTIGFASGEIPRIPLNLVLLKGCVVKGFEIRTFAEHEPTLAARDETELLNLFRTEQLSPHISSVYEIDKVADALHQVTSRRSIGKVLLRLGD